MVGFISPKACDLSKLFTIYFLNVLLEYQIYDIVHVEGSEFVRITHSDRITGGVHTSVRNSTARIAGDYDCVLFRGVCKVVQVRI